MAAVASSPPISGIWTSISTTSKAPHSTAASASRPLLATVVSCPRFERSPTATRWLTTLSSASSTLSERTGRPEWRSSEAAGSAFERPSSARQMAVYRSAASTGLVRYVAMPSSRQRVWSPYWPDEVSIMIVAPASSGRFIICSATPKPSISGMLASSRTRTNGVCASAAAARASMAAAPLPTAVGRVCHRVSWPSRMRRLTRLSSTMSTGSSASSGSGMDEGSLSHSVVSNAAVKLNVLPRPTSLSTQIRPPII